MRSPLAVMIAVLALAAAPSASSTQAGPAAGERAAPAGPYREAVRISAKFGSRPAGGRNERRAHAYVARRFRAAGLEVNVSPFRVPGRGRSRNVIGALDTPASCLIILMAHTDSVPPGLGANDNASGVGALVALAPPLAALDPPCDVWLVATGAEERPVTGTRYHAGAAALVKEVRRAGRADDLHYALSVDMVGRGKRFYLRSPRPSTRPGVEGAVLTAANRAGVVVRWARDSGQGNSDHREFELAGLPAAVLQVWKGIDPCHHERCDRPGRLQKGGLGRVQRMLEELLRGA